MKNFFFLFPLFIFSTNILPSDLSKRLDKIKHLRESSIRCNVSRPNMALFRKKILTEDREDIVSCLESKQLEVNEFYKAIEDRHKEIKGARDFINKYSCNELNDRYRISVCTFLKSLIR